MTPPYTPSCLPNWPAVDDATQMRFDENRELLEGCDDITLSEILIQQPFETLYNECARLSRQQIESVADAIFDRFVRARPAAACLYASWRLNRRQIAYLFVEHPWDIIIHAPSLLNAKQLRQCVIRYPDMALQFAAKYLQSTDFVRLCISLGASFIEEPLLENAYRLEPKHFVRLLRNPSTRVALANIVTDEQLVQRETVASLLLEACRSLTESELDEAAPVLRAIASEI